MQERSWPRRLTPEALGALRHRSQSRRSTQRQLVHHHRRADGGDDNDDGSMSSDDGGSEKWPDEESFCENCPCLSIRMCLACVLLVAIGIVWSIAISMGIMRKPTYEEYARPLRVARRNWFMPTPTGADDGFILFDVDADGRVSVEDITEVAIKTTGERPSLEQVQRYIAQADIDGDGGLNETEYQELLRIERVNRKHEAALRGINETQYLDMVRAQRETRLREARLRAQLDELGEEEGL